ncbi:hypothetical protein IEQ34_010324 [Dendrobium chrysotoxum]|uniref:Uncharacterized protein n=1 Tax=Dendrobium chrysotoxum TaxID=161865 RepID=A0AAV7GLV1_DENCH|nr:hypothetical protein IEQ34_010324 [Dendrobium chrysotoxum]
MGLLTSRLPDSDTHLSLPSNTSSLFSRPFPVKLSATVKFRSSPTFENSSVSGLTTTSTPLGFTTLAVYFALASPTFFTVRCTVLFLAPANPIDTCIDG